MGGVEIKGPWYVDEVAAAETVLAFISVDV